MSEEIKSIPLIPDNAIMTIEVSGHFHKMLVNLLIGLCETRPKDEITTILAKLKTDEPHASLFELNIDVVLSLINDIEKAAKDQNKLEYKEIKLAQVSIES